MLNLSKKFRLRSRQFGRSRSTLAATRVVTPSTLTGITGGGHRRAEPRRAVAHIHVIICSYRVAPFPALLHLYLHAVTILMKCKNKKFYPWIVPGPEALWSGFTAFFSVFFSFSIINVSGSQLVGRDPKVGRRPVFSGSWAFAWEGNAKKTKNKKNKAP